MPNPDAILDSPQQARMRSVSHALCTAFADLPESSLALLAATLNNIGESRAAHAVRQFAKESVAGTRVPELWAEDARVRARAAIAVPLAEHVRELRDTHNVRHQRDRPLDGPCPRRAQGLDCWCSERGETASGETATERDERRNTRGL